MNVLLIGYNRALLARLNKPNTNLNKTMSGYLIRLSEESFMKESVDEAIIANGG
jgi:hypothetical protein